MENYRVKIRKRRNAFIGASILLGGLMVFWIIRVINNIRNNPGTIYEGFVEGFRTGIFFALMGGCIINVVRYSKALKNDKKLRVMLTKEKDERNIFISSKMGEIGFNVVLIAVAVATLVAGSFDFIIFSTLLGVLFFIVFTKLILGIYLEKKY